jgi:methylated-DNA-protein-cysteine methyltransferase related protein
MASTFDKIYSMVCRIPAGRVATYGQIARMTGTPRRARQVGYALAALHDHQPVPWHRVVNAKGGISPRADPGYEEFQRILLENEGIVFNEGGYISLSRYQWRPDTSAQ